METREQVITRMEASGDLDPKCATCQQEYYARTDRRPCDIFAPPHKAMNNCRSGKRPHCTCDTCF